MMGGSRRQLQGARGSPRWTRHPYFLLLSVLYYTALHHSFSFLFYISTTIRQKASIEWFEPRQLLKAGEYSSRQRLGSTVARGGWASRRWARGAGLQGLRFEEGDYLEEQVKLTIFFLLPPLFFPLLLSQRRFFPLSLFWLSTHSSRNTHSRTKLDSEAEQLSVFVPSVLSQLLLKN